MDVIALRKGSGNISGTVLLNGFPQEPISFRRCSGYVEQFGETDLIHRRPGVHLIIIVIAHKAYMLSQTFSQLSLQ